MFGLGMFGGGGQSPWAGIRQGMNTGMSGGSGFGGMAGAGQQLMQAGRPQFAGQPGAAPAGQPGPQGFQPPQGFPGGMFGGGFPGSMFGGGGAYPQMLMQAMQKLQQGLGPTSEAGWGMGTTTTPTPSRWASPQNLMASFFNRGGYQ